MHKAICLIITALFTAALHAQQPQPPIPKEKWHRYDPNKQDTSAGYAQAVKVGNVRCISVQWH